ncbi:TPA: tyrosine-type recombinase/integrase [Escherichia coli]
MLSDTKLRAIAGKAYTGPDELADAGGLSARVSAKGKITFQYRYRFNGKPVRLKLGDYGIMSLKEARAAVAECKEILAEGKNPATVLRQRIEGEKEKKTINDVVNDYLSMTNVKKLVNYMDIKSFLQRYVVKDYGFYIVDDITTRQWMDIFSKITEAGYPVQAGIVLKRMKIVIDNAIRRDMVTSQSIKNVRVIDIGNTPGIGERYLSTDEIVEFWHAVEISRIYSLHKYALRLLLLTGCRVIELRDAKRSHFDLDNGVWTVPAEISKTRRLIRRGLSDYAVSLLREVMATHDKEYLFPPARSQDDKPACKTVIKKAALFVCNRMSCEAWSCHDLRRTCRTHLAAIGVAPHIAEKVLGHSLSGVLAVYDKYDYIDEQKEAMNKWANYVLSLVDTKPRS